MLFNSLEFIIFFPIVTLLYFLVPHKYRWLQLLVASCIFYAAFIPSYLLILLLLIVTDYSAGILIERSVHKKKWLVVSIIANIGLLAIFKYFNFFVGNLSALTGTDLLLLHWVLPIGLSFHTFQSMSYTIEVYRGRQKAVRHPGYYALYVMFYPQLVAGPIERPYHLFPQLFARHKFSFQNLYEGLRLMAWGFFKKTVVADRLGEYVDAVFNDPSAADAGNIWLALIFFGVQIYADFSGYSDIALGSARCMGFDLVINFNRPYFATNIQEFWRRWHISLYSWFRDYVYIPLGGNRKGKARKNLNTILTFGLSGLWHGAGWTFIVWGLLHGLYVVVYDSLTGLRNKIKLPRFFGWFIVVLLVSYAWIFFRAESFADSWLLIQESVNIKNFNLATLTSVKTPTIQYGNFSMLFIFTCFVYLFLVEWFTTPLLTNLNSKKWMDLFLFTSSLLAIIFYGVFHKTSFIYFQF